MVQGYFVKVNLRESKEGGPGAVRVLCCSSDMSVVGW